MTTARHRTKRSRRPVCLWIFLSLIAMTVQSLSPRSAGKNLPRTTTTIMTSSSIASSLTYRRRSGTGAVVLSATRSTPGEKKKRRRRKQQQEEAADKVDRTTGTSASSSSESSSSVKQQQQEEEEEEPSTLLAAKNSDNDRDSMDEEEMDIASTIMDVANFSFDGVIEGITTVPQQPSLSTTTTTTTTTSQSSKASSTGVGVVPPPPAAATTTAPPEAQDGAIPLPDIKDVLRRKEVREEMARIEEEQDAPTKRIDRNDRKALLKLLEQQPYADADASFFEEEEYTTVSALLGEGAKPFLGIPTGPLQVGHFIGALVIVLMAFVEYPGFPLTNLPTPLRGALQGGLGVVYLLNTILAVLAAFRAAERGQPAFLWIAKTFSVGGLAYDQLTQLPTTEEMEQAKARKGKRALKNPTTKNYKY